MRELFVGTTLLVTFVAGMVALFAPCCVSVMLPAFIAASARRGVALVAMTFAFAAGLATLVLPVAIGASWISGAISSHHLAVYGVGALAMVALGVATLAGWQLHLPMPGRRAVPNPGPGAAYLLGLFSGIASACCAPVLAGIVAISGASASFPVAVIVGVTFVAGMVAPLFVMALLWGRHQQRFSSVSGRQVRLPLTGRHVSLASAIGGVLLIIMGMLVGALAVTGPQMAPTGWQATLSGDIDHYASLITKALSAVPGWVFALLLVVSLTLLTRTALNQTPTSNTDGPVPGERPTDARSDDFAETPDETRKAMDR